MNKRRCQLVTPGIRRRGARRASPVLLIFALLLIPRFGYGEGPDSCVECHRPLPDKLGAAVAKIDGDIHYQNGLSCADCHGGDPKDPGLTAMDPGKGFRGVPAKKDIPGFCGRCHSDENYMRRFNPGLSTDQEAQYKTSVHGRRLAEGDTKVATCVSCHSVHDIRPVNNAQAPVYPANVPRICAGCHSDAAVMAGYNIPTDQFAQYQHSVHGVALLVKRDLAAPTCSDCHGNHGAFPPGADTVAAVCGQCHGINRDFFIKSPHKDAFHELGLPECVTCHGKHEVLKTSDDMLGIGDLAVCVTCHTSKTAGYAVAKTLRTRLDDLKTVMGQTEKVLDRAERAGMEVGEIRYEYQNIHPVLVQARNVIHTCSVEALNEVVAEGERIAAKAGEAGKEALGELHTRKTMMAIPLGAIGLVVVLLVVKIRDLEKP